MYVLHWIEKFIDTLMSFIPRKMPASNNIQQARMIAHRGAHDRRLKIQENTQEAFDRALALGCDGIEFDVQTTADGVLVVNHDPTLKRLWGHDVAIGQLSFAELRALVPELPCLAEVIARYGKHMHLFIELKAPFNAIHSLAVGLDGLIPCVDYHLLSLEPELFENPLPFPKKSLLLVPIHHNVRKFCQISVEKGYGGVLAHYLLLRDRRIQRLRKANQMVGVGFTDSTFGIYRELNRGVHWLFTNDAAEAASCLRQLRDKTKYRSQIL